MKIKKSFAILSAFVALVVLAACGGAGGGGTTAPAAPATGAAPAAPAAPAPAEAGQEPVHLVVWMAGAGDLTQLDAYGEVLSNFVAENPHITYELTFIAWGDYFTALNTALIGGVGPDVFMLGFGQAGTVYAGGDVLDLTPHIPADWDGWDDFLPNILEIGQIDGRQVALFNPSTRVILYRRDIAEQNGVTADELNIRTPEDFYNLVRRMTVFNEAGNVEVFGFDITPAMSSEQELFFQAMMYDPGFTLWDDNFMPNFNTADAITAWNMVNTMFEEGYLALRDAGATAGIQRGVSSMSMVAETAYAVADSMFPGQIGVIRNDMNTLLIGNYKVVNSATRNVQESVDLLLHMFSVESSVIFAEVMTQYSGRQSLDNHFVGLNPDFENIIHAYARSFSYGATFNPMFNQGIATLRLALETAFHGTPTADALATSQAEWSALLN